MPKKLITDKKVEDEMQRLIVYLLVPIALGGCATVDDFRNMSANQRGQKVCSTRNDFKNLNSQKRQYNQAIADIQQALTRGYRVHTDCKNVQVLSGNSSASCQSDNYGNTNCTQVTPTVNQTQCTDTPVALNYDLEKDKLSQYQDEYAAADAKLSKFWVSCMKYVTNLSPEDAYAAYKK